MARIFKTTNRPNGHASAEGFTRTRDNLVALARSMGGTMTVEDLMRSSGISTDNPDYAALKTAVKARLDAEDATRHGVVMEECNVGPGPLQMAAEGGAAPMA